MKSLLFGTAGIPISAMGGTTTDGISQVKKLGLGAMELEFVRSVNISEDKAPDVRKVAEKEGIVLTCHAPYFINLNALEKAKAEASKFRIIKSAKVAHLCGGYSVCFHPGFYMGMDPKKVYENVKNNLKDIIKKLEDIGVDIWVRPETTGKETQFGNVDELLQLSTEFDQVMPCIDFSHLHARSSGKYNTKAEFAQVLEKVEKSLGRNGLENMHIHVAGIEYGPKGEKNHLDLKNSDMNYKDLIKVWKEFKIKGVVISESPNIEEDALLMKKTYEGYL